MANRYWVGTGTWDGTTTTNWSTTSGGTGGASVPTTADAVFFDANSVSCTVSGARNCGGVDCTGFTGTLSIPLSQTINSYGTVLFVSGATITSNGTIGIRATGSVTTAGKTLNILTINASTGTVTLQDNVTCTTITHTNGTLNLNGKTVSATNYSLGIGTQNLTFNGGTVSLTSSLDMNSLNTNFTTTAGTGTGKISFSGAGNKSFGYHAAYPTRSATFNCTVENASTNQLTIYGNHTINNITNSVSPTTFKFDTSQATTVNNFNVSGTSGNLVTIASTSTGTQATLSKSSGTVSVSYCSITDSNATGGATWQAYTANGNVNGGNNTGWSFSTTTASGNGLFFGSNF